MTSFVGIVKALTVLLQMPAAAAVCGISCRAINWQREEMSELIWEKTTDMAWAMWDKSDYRCMLQQEPRCQDSEEVKSKLGPLTTEKEEAIPTVKNSEIWFHEFELMIQEKNKYLTLDSTFHMFQLSHDSEEVKRQPGPLTTEERKSFQQSKIAKSSSMNLSWWYRRKTNI